jgi:hypothetical protein
MEVGGEKYVCICVGAGVREGEGFTNWSGEIW